MRGIRWDGGFFVGGFIFWRDDVFFLGRGLIDTAYPYLLYECLDFSIIDCKL